MSIDLTGSPGGLFRRLAKLFQAIRSGDRYGGDTNITGATPDLDAIGTSYTEILAQYASNEQYLMDQLAGGRDQARSQQGGWKSFLAQLSTDTVIRQVDR